MALRVLTALLGLPVLLGAVWLGFPYLTILVGAVAVLALREFYGLAPGLAAYRGLTFVGILYTLLFLVGGQFADPWHQYSPGIAFAALVFIAGPWLMARRGRNGRVAMVPFLVAGPVYVGFLLSHGLALRELDGGADYARDWLLFALLVTFASDTGAFLTGRAVGRHRMAPSVSPGKTWEGAAGGFLWSAGAAAGLGALLQLGAPVWQAALVGVAVGAMAQLGDLAESRIKRASGVKDTGALLPGHGGLLDRLDSIVFTLPVVYYLVALVLKPSG